MDRAYVLMTEERLCTNDCGYFKVPQLHGVDWSWRAASGNWTFEICE